MKQLSSEQAIEFAKSGVWENWTDEEIVKFQLYQDCLCMDFSRFHGAVEAVLRRPVFTHEFADQDGLQAEYEGKRPAPTFEEIINMIPAEKRILIGV